MMVAFVAGCGRPVAVVNPIPAPAVVVEEAVAQEDIVTPDIEVVPPAIVTQIQALSEEVRALRNQVEVLATELSGTRQRQKDLYDDLDARLRKVERMISEGSRISPNVEGVLPESVSAPTDQTNENVAEIDDGASVQVVPIEPVPAADPAVVRAEYDNAFRTLRQGKYEDAIIAFGALVENYPDSELVDDALYWIAEAHYVTQEFTVALQGFEQIIADYPDNRRAAEAMLKIGYIYYDQQNFEQAKNYLTEVMERYPASRSAFSAQRRLAKMQQEGHL